MPAIGAANEVERGLLRSMYEMRGYGFTEEPKFLERCSMVTPTAGVSVVLKGLRVWWQDSMARQRRAFVRK